MENFKWKHLFVGVPVFLAIAVPQSICFALGIVFILGPLFLALSLWYSKTWTEGIFFSVLLTAYLGGIFWCLGWPATFIDTLPDGWLWQTLYGFVTAIVLFVLLSVYGVLSDSIMERRLRKRCNRP